MTRRPASALVHKISRSFAGNAAELAATNGVLRANQRCGDAEDGFAFFFVPRFKSRRIFAMLMSPPKPSKRSAFHAWSISAFNPPLGTRLLPYMRDFNRRT